MKLAIIGTRYEPIPSDIESRVRALVMSTDVRDWIVTGDCPTGIDRIVRMAADGERFLVICKAPWKTFGRSAGPRRNEMIAEIADRVVACPMGESVGTYGCIEAFRRLGKDVEVWGVMAAKKVGQRP